MWGPTVDSRGSCVSPETWVATAPRGEPPLRNSQPGASSGLLARATRRWYRPSVVPPAVSGAALLRVVPAGPGPARLAILAASRAPHKECDAQDDGSSAAICAAIRLHEVAHRGTPLHTTSRPDRVVRPRRRGRAAECTGFENRRGATHRGFESSRLRQNRRCGVQGCAAVCRAMASQMAALRT